MSDGKQFWALLIIGFLAFAEFSSWITASWPGDCVVSPEQYNNAANQTEQKYCPTFVSGAWIILKRTDAAISSHDKSIVAVFTVVLAVSTIGLWGATVRLWAAGERQLELIARNAVQQSQDMQASIAAAQKAADAADLSAKGAIGVELPIITLDHMRLSRTAGVSGILVGYPGELSEPRIGFRNHGRTAAELTAWCVEWAVEKRLPEIPTYKTIVPYMPGTFLPEYAGQPYSFPLSSYVIRLKADEISAIEDESEYLWVFGYLAYRDFLGNPHEMRFCAKWEAYGPTRADGSKVPLGFVYESEIPPAYTRKT